MHFDYILFPQVHLDPLLLPTQNFKLYLKNNNPTQ